MPGVDDEVALLDGILLINVPVFAIRWGAGVGIQVGTSVHVRVIDLVGGVTFVAIGLHGGQRLGQD